MQHLNERDAANLHSMVHRLASAKMRGLPVPFSFAALMKWHKVLASELVRNNVHHRKTLVRSVQGAKR